MPIQIIITSESALEAIADMEAFIRAGYADEAAAVATAPSTKSEAIAAAIKAGVFPRVVSTPETEAAPEPEAPAKRTRRTKAQIEADKAEEAKPNISADPENRVDPAEATEAPEDDADVALPEEKEADFFDDEAPAAQDDMIDGYAITDQGLQAVMHAYVAKFDMAAAQKNAKALFGGFNKRSEVAAAGDDALRTAIANFSRAVSSGKEV